VALAESCTGGLAGDLITRAAGSSEVFELGVVTYANEFKHRILEVPRDVLEQHGAVSKPCVLAMARGVRRLAGSTYGVAISGIAGPGGGTADKPVGTVHFGLVHEGGERHVERRFPWVHERQRIKQISAHVAFALVLGHLRGGAAAKDPLAGRWAPAAGERS
jgi:PncC family amidohydrolase